MRGGASLLRAADDSYDAIEPILLDITGGAFPFTRVFLVMAEDVRETIAPLYPLYLQTTESDQIAIATARYGVRPRN